jgi:hypothetical protein
MILIALSSFDYSPARESGGESPLFTPLIQTKSNKLFHIFTIDKSLSVVTTNQYCHHAQTPLFEASLPNQWRCLSDGGLDDERLSRQMCLLGTNRQSHWLRGLLF